MLEILEMDNALMTGSVRTLRDPALFVGGKGNGKSSRALRGSSWCPLEWLQVALRFFSPINYKEYLCIWEFRG